MHDGFFIFNFINRKTAMQNLFINRTGTRHSTNNYTGMGYILFDISFTNKSEADSNISFAK